MSTIDDVVRKSGVSRSTVFRFLNGSSVRESSKERIILAMEELKYKIEEIDKHKNFLIEISISEDYDEFQGFVHIVKGIVESAENVQIPVQIVKRTGNQIDKDYNSWNDSNYNKGVLVIGKNKVDETKEAKYLIDKKIPHIFINRVLPDLKNSYVSVDLESAAYDIVSYLIDKGHKKILVAGNPLDLLVDENKINGYKRALLDHNIEFNKSFYNIVSDKKDWEEDVKKILKSDDIPTAYFGICDSYSIQFINIARKLGYNIPENISVVGMDDVDIVKYCYPPLTTVYIPFKEMGTTAVYELIRLLNKEISSVKLLLDYTLIERESVLEYNNK